MKTNFFIRPMRLADAIVAELTSAIGKEQYAPGQRLPTEAAMAVEYGVSRAVVREAISQLKADGLVVVRQGAGAYVASSPGSSSFKILPLLDSEDVKLGHLFELRLCVEGSAAQMAALRRQPEDLARIRGYLDRMSTAIKRGDYGSQDDGLFHEAVARASQNPELARFVIFLGHAFGKTRKPSWTAKGLAIGLAHKAADEHEAIFKAIAEGDGEGARRAAEVHILNTQERTLA